MKTRGARVLFTGGGCGSISRNPRIENQGFTRLDLLAVICVAAVFLSSLLAGHSSTQSTSAMSACMRNVRSLIEGWHGYVEDHEGMLPASSGEGLNGDSSPWHGGGWLDMPVWRLDNLDPYAAEGSISQGAIWEYAGSDPSIWRCPADPSTGSHPDYMGGASVSRVRSYSMNNWMNAIPWLNGWTVFYKISDFALAGPADLFLLSGERYDSINDGHMLVEMTGFRSDDGTRGARNRGCKLVDFPSNYHRNAECDRIRRRTCRSRTNGWTHARRLHLSMAN